MVTIDILAAFNSAISALLYGLFFSFIMNLVILVFKISQLVTHAFFADEYNEKSYIKSYINPAETISYCSGMIPTMALCT